MSAQLNLNTHQAYGYFYDQRAAGWCVPQNPALASRNVPRQESIIAHVPLPSTLFSAATLLRLDV